MSEGITKISGCFTWKIFAECDYKSDQPNCVKMKNDAKACMTILGSSVTVNANNAATTTLQEADV